MIIGVLNMVSNPLCPKSSDVKLFGKNTNLQKFKQSRSKVDQNYKVLLCFLMLFGFPYTPYQLREPSFSGDSPFLMSVSGCIHLCRTFICFISVVHTHMTLPTNSLALTFSVFNLFSLVLSWCVFFRRRRVLDTLRMVIAMTDRVWLAEFRSKWQVYILLLFNIFGFACGVAGTSFLNSYLHEHAYMQKYFLWFEFDEEYIDVFHRYLSSLTIATYMYNGAVCALVILQSSTVYFHLGDILNFTANLKKKFQPVDGDCLYETLRTADQITGLNEAVEQAFSVAVLLVYGAMLSTFFMGISLLASFRDAVHELRILVLAVFGFSTYCFLIITITGDRIRKKREELVKAIAVGVHSHINTNGLSEKEVPRFSLVLSEIKSVDWQVTGGGMFVISSSVILSVAGTLITYGIIISQMG